MKIIGVLNIFIITILMVGCTSNDDMNNSKSSTELSETSEITCPKCGHKKVEILPIDVCTIKYTCENCKTELTPKIGDCCVFCTYGTHKCPSMQEQ